MRFFARILWIALFIVATYSWMVAFEHGFAWKGFSAGFQNEWKNLSAMLTGRDTTDTSIPSAPTPKK